jgi:hypothetical protein
MNRSRKIFFVWLLVVLAALTFLTTSTLMARKTTCVYNPETQSIDYTITDGDAVDYEIHAIVAGCVATAGDPPGMTGPDASGSVGVTCNTMDSFGSIEIQICTVDPPVCFDSYQLKFRCEPDCQIRYIGSGVPSLTIWGVVILLVLITVTGLYFARKRSTVKE